MKGFTLIELMVVILIVAILAAVALPMYRAKIDAAKWTEGKATMGMIANALRTYVVLEQKAIQATPTLAQLGVAPGVLDGTYFKGGESGSGDYSWVITSPQPLEYVVTAKAPTGIRTPSEVRLDATGQWTAIP